MHAAPVQRTILSTRRIMVPPLTLCAYMKKGPNLRWSLIQCSGGDEGDRTPDLLTASQALSQLSYAPVRRSTIRELPRRCKDNFGKFRSRGAGRHPPNGRPAGARSVTGADRAPADPAISKPCRFTGPGREPPEHVVIGKIKTAGRRLAHSVKCRAWTAGPGPAP